MTLRHPSDPLLSLLFYPIVFNDVKCSNFNKNLLLKKKEMVFAHAKFDLIHEKLLIEKP